MESFIWFFKCEDVIGGIVMLGFYVQFFIEVIFLIEKIRLKLVWFFDCFIFVIGIFGGKMLEEVEIFFDFFGVVFLEGVYIFLEENVVIMIKLDVL